MSYNPVSGFTLQTIKQNGETASDYYLKLYIANTTTPLNMATDATGGTLLSEVKLNDNGMPISNPLDNSTVFIPHVDQSYRLVIYRNKADADANNTAAAYVNIPEVSSLVSAGDGIITPIDSVADLPTDAVYGQTVHVNGYHADTNKGGDDFTFKSGQRHNGGTKVDPTRTFPTDWNDPVQVSAWFADSGIDTDCFVRNGVEYVTDDMFGGEISQAISAAKSDSLYVVINEDTSVLIPTHADTMQDVLDYVGAVGDYTVTINIETGHAITSGLKCSNGHYGNYVITSDDSIVSLDPAFVGASVTAGENANTSGANNSFVFLGINSVLPEIQILVDMDNAVGLGDGLNLSNSSASVATGCGVVNATNRGCVVWGNSEIFARGSVWDGAGDEGIRVQSGCSADFRLTSADDCMLNPTFGEAAIYISRSSIVELRDGTCTGSGSDGLKARRSLVTATGVDASGANINSGSACILAESGAIVEASGASANNGARGFWANAGGKIVLDGGTATGNATTDIWIGSGGLVVGNAETTNSGGGGETVLSDTNAPAFNTWYSSGAILNDEVEESVEKGSSGTHTWYKYADGRMTYHVNGDVIPTGTISSGNFTGQLAKPVLNESFVEIHSANFDSVGRAGSGGTGARIGTYLIGRPTIIVDSIKAFNTGEQTDSATTGTSIESILIYWTIFGTWK